MKFKTLNASLSPLLILTLLIPNFVFGQSNNSGNLQNESNKTSRNETVNLPKYVRDVTEETRIGQIQTTKEYQNEADEIVESLGVSAKKNIVLVDKTAVSFDVLMNELALRLTTQDAPPNLRGKKLWQLNLNQLLSQ